MNSKLFKWIGKNKDEEKPIISLLKFLYLVSYDWIKSIFDLMIPFALTALINIKNVIGIVFVVVLIIIVNVWYSVVNSYNKYKYKINKNDKMILEEITAITTTLDNYIIDNGNEGIFEFASDLVSSSLYNTLKKVVNCDIRISVIQQFIQNGNRSCVMLSRYSKSRQNCQKSQRSVKYDKNKQKNNYYYLKILADNKENMIIFNEKQINKHFCHKNKNRKSNIKQYLCIPDKIETNNIIFLLQLDAMKEDAFGKSEQEINDFYDNYIHPYDCYLRHAYNIAKKINSENKKRNGDDRNE